ncbi:NUDIX hydrolase [Treponema sp. OMZ 840]|uniref:NUDIX hydrolase n=1 Tax=Treponema sp. OMZ 840 TaxID=244313 RepID=UPI003D933AB8
MQLTEQKKTIGKTLYKSKSYAFRVDTVVLPDGNKTKREVLIHPGGVAILALSEDKRIAVVKQYRYAIDKVTVEIPAGKMDKIPGEQPLETAKRELKEETGLEASVFEYLGAIYPSPGIMTEILHLYFAANLHMSRQELDEDEFIEVDWIDCEKLEKDICSGDITDCKTICAFSLAKIRGFI